MKYLNLILGVCLLGGAAGYGLHHYQVLHEAQQEVAPPAAGMEAKRAEVAEVIRTMPPPSYAGSSASGSYLSGRFAQRHHDWKTAGKYMDFVLEKHPENDVLLKRAMVLSIGAGDYLRGFQYARKIIEQYEGDNSLSHMFLAAESFKAKNYQKAAEHIAAMPEGGLSAFIMPLLESWSQAALGVYNVDALKTNSVHLYHAILISDYMDRTDVVRDMLKQALGAGELNTEDIQRIADIYAHIGEKDSALKLYEQALSVMPDNAEIKEKYEALEAGETADVFIRIESPEVGVAEAFHDMARLLAQEYSDESARVFGRVALYLDPALTKGRFMLAEIAARNERYDDAIKLYNSVDANDEEFVQAKRFAAEILHDEGRNDEAVDALKQILEEHDDLDAVIQIGDIYRVEQDFKNSIKFYNKAFEMLGEITPQYWHLYYVRGMSYEQDGQWKKAEADLQAALEFRPNHPYVLNYLGYAWADQGENLDKALDMIEQAVELRPGDGYITDSLGWVYYRMGRYNLAVPYLEQAVELMPYDPVINDHLGDAYWKVGRTLEAEFQWTRAKNHSDDDELITAIEDKLLNGLDMAKADPQPVKEPPVDTAAQNDTSSDTPQTIQ